ncbi:MAG: NAD(P)/FAD-dependent oxidoreductase [Candidatus Sericytochromatia bacterium]|nr:NAD(P)/FAD-dependent oxidoreductase [Candidatus Sericytochromatia bacterium]
MSPDSHHDYDVAVIGAGVVGLAVAAGLAPHRRVLIVGRHGRIGTETSSRNSEGIHAGIYYPAGSLKATLCVEGNRRLYALCERHGIPHARVGKLIVATQPGEIGELARIHATAAANGVDLTWVGPEVAEWEPAVKAVAALWSPTTGIIDSHALMRHYQHVAVDHGADLVMRCTLIGADRTGDGYALRLQDAAGEMMTVQVGQVVNSAGLDADRIAALVGIDPKEAGYELSYCRGVYFRLSSRHQGRVKCLIYPVPAPQTVGLGVHVTLDLAGQLRLGPDVEYLKERRQDYLVDERRRDSFHEAVSRYLIGVAPEDLTVDQAGIRPKLQGPGQPARDFVIAEESARGLPGWVNLIGIESPGLTCAPVIADRVAALLRVIES